MKLEKIMKTLDKDTLVEMEALDLEGLRSSIIASENAMRQVQMELDANEEYQALLESKKAMESAKKEVDKRQRAKIGYALHLLEEKGQ